MGLGEKPIEVMPLDYQQLYQRCWNNDPNLRPDIEVVYEILIKLKTGEFLDSSIAMRP
jgi:hypothetical protein